MILCVKDSKANDETNSAHDPKTPEFLHNFETRILDRATRLKHVMVFTCSLSSCNNANTVGAALSMPITIKASIIACSAAIREAHS